MAEEKDTALPVTPVKTPTLVPGAGMVPAYSNRFHLWVNDKVVRIVIGDSVSGTDVTFNYMFVMTRDHAEEMANAILQLLGQTAPPVQTSDKT